MVAPSSTPVVFSAESEGFLELIENEHGRHEAVALIPESCVGAMEILPERLALADLGGLDFARRARLAQRRMDLGDDASCG